MATASRRASARRVRTRGRAFRLSACRLPLSIDHSVFIESVLAVGQAKEGAFLRHPAGGRRDFEAAWFPCFRRPVSFSGASLKRTRDDEAR